MSWSTSIRARSHRYRWIAVVLFSQFLSGVSALAVDDQPKSSNQEPPPPTAEALPRIREFAAGVRIDWTNQVVLVSARVNLRQGPLELLACSPKTREHESILVIESRPFHVYQAMGLIGIKPGQPVRYDEENDRWTAASGDRVDVRIRCEAPGFDQSIPGTQWLESVVTDEPPEKLEWVFSGSRSYGGDKFAADSEGTVVCVVDFDTALISLHDMHSADNDALWLRARTEAIPPVGTPCTLMIRSAEPPAENHPAATPVENSAPSGDNVHPNGNNKPKSDFGG